MKQKLYQINHHTTILDKPCDCLVEYRWFYTDEEATEYVNKKNEEENTNEYFWSRENINRELID